MAQGTCCAASARAIAHLDLLPARVGRDDFKLSFAAYATGKSNAQREKKDLGRSRFGNGAHGPPPRRGSCWERSPLNPNVEIDDPVVVDVDLAVVVKVAVE